MQVLQLLSCIWAFRGTMKVRKKLGSSHPVSLFRFPPLKTCVGIYVQEFHSKKKKNQQATTKEGFFSAYRQPQDITRKQE